MVTRQRLSSKKMRSEDCCDQGAAELRGLLWLRTDEIERTAVVGE